MRNAESSSSPRFSRMFVDVNRRCSCGEAHHEASERSPANIPVPDTSDGFARFLAPDGVAGAVCTPLVSVQGVGEGHHALTSGAMVNHREVHFITRLALEERSRQFLGCRVRPGRQGARGGGLWLSFFVASSSPFRVLRPATPAEPLALPVLGATHSANRAHSTGRRRTYPAQVPSWAVSRSRHQ